MSSTTKSDRRWSALALIVTAQFMVILDVAIVNVALPSIKSDLNFSQTNLQWVVSAYAIMFGGALLLGGRLADLLGRRRLFMAGLALFAASSLLCGLAWSESSLIAFRAVQGLGGALLAPAALSLLMTRFAEGRDRNLALGIYGAASGSGAAVGVLLGGVLTSYLSWSWIFFINVPVGVAAIALAPLLLQESRADVAHRHFDFPGAASITAGLMLLVYAMTRATSDGWGSGSTLALLAGAAALVLAFVAIELRSPSPLLPLRIFRSRTLSAANAAMAIVGAVAFSEFFVLTLYLQDVLHYSAVMSGAAFAGLALSVVVLSNVARDRRTLRRSPNAHRRPAALGDFGRVADSPAGRRALLLGSLPGVRARWGRHGAFLRPCDDRESHGRRALRCRSRIGPDQHEPPDRRRDRDRRLERRRRQLNEQLRSRAFRRSNERCGARPRLPNRPLRADGPAADRRADRSDVRQVGAGAEHARRSCRRRVGRAGRGCLTELAWMLA